MNQGKLILIPNLLGDSNYKDAINEKIIQTLKETNFFIVENVRTVRRYIKKIVPEKSIDDITFFSYGKHDNLILMIFLSLTKYMLWTMIIIQKS